MARWKIGAAAALAVLMLSGAGCATHETATHETATLAGDWTTVQVLREGKVDPALSGHRIRFDGDHFAITRDGKTIFGGRVALDPGASPPEIDFDQVESKTLAGTWKGIYALKGDRLVICDDAYAMEKPRPKRFEDCSAPGYILFRFKRAK